MKKKKRCQWAENVPDIYIKYHDEEWGVPVKEDAKLFEMLLLESFQAGLSWITILKKREFFREAFDHFDPNLIANYDEQKCLALQNNKNIIRNKLKIKAAVKNAAIFLEIQKDYGSFSNYIWGFTNGEVIFSTEHEKLVSSPLSDAISADLMKRGMKFVGTIIVYSYLQSVGVVNDHEPTCFKYR